MLQFPPIPSWESLHPLIIHFPIVLLLIAPLVILVSAILPPTKSRPYILMGLAGVLLGTATLFIAASSGEAAAELADRDAAINAVLESHEHLASASRIVFSALSVLLIGIVALPRILSVPPNRTYSSVLPLAFLVLYSTGMVFLANTAHAGGRLVHQYGVHTMMPPAEAQSSEVVRMSHED